MGMFEERVVLWNGVNPVTITLGNLEPITLSGKGPHRVPVWLLAAVTDSIFCHQMKELK